MNNRECMVQRAMLVLVSFLLPANLNAQHKLFRFNEPPGALAHKRLIAEPGIADFDQPVKVIVDPGGDVSFWDGAGFTPIQSPDMLLGMRVGPVFQLKISAILREQLVEVYPTIEMLDRLYPPEGYSTIHPVNIVFEQSDIEDAAQGKLVTKVIYLEDPDTALPYRLSPAQQAIIDVGSGTDPLTTADRLGRIFAIVRIGSRQPSTSSPEFGYQTPVQMFAAQPPIESMNSHVGCPVYSCCPDDIACLPKSRRDEYVCDGHDRELPVVVSRYTAEMKGLDIEDTVATFRKPTGETEVAPSNRVCIYSPRFAAVRRVLGTNYETITQKLNIVNEKTRINTAVNNEKSSLAFQNVQLQLNKKTQRANQFIDRTRGVVSDNVVKLSKASHSYKAYEDLSLIRFGRFDSSETSRISLGMQSAIAWEGRLSAQITIDNEQPVVVNDTYQVQEFVSIQTETHADLRLCKLASTISAKSGETVEFTIRFDNIGRSIIREVKIVDNLSPRLEFVTDSAECSVDAEFSITANTAGSALLEWKLIEPLKIRDGGIIRFQCRVR